MEIITQNYEKILENVIINNFETIIRQKEKENKRENKVFNYIRILDTLDETICKIARESLETIINTLDRSYKNSAERLQEIKDSVEFQYTLAKTKGYDNALLFTNEEKELIEEIERLKKELKN